MNTQPYIEQDCTVRFGNRSFESGGAFISDDYLVAYPAEGGILNDWHGNRIGAYAFQSSRPAVFFGRRSWIGDRYYTMRAWVNGQTYTLRGFGVGMVARGKVRKSA